MKEVRNLKKIKKINYGESKIKIYKKGEEFLFLSYDLALASNTKKYKEYYNYILDQDMYIGIFEVDGIEKKTILLNFRGAITLLGKLNNDECMYVLADTIEDLKELEKLEIENTIREIEKQESIIVNNNDIEGEKNMDNIMIFENKETGMNLKGINRDGVPMFDAESVSISLGFFEIAKSGNRSVKWARINKYLGIDTTGDTSNYRLKKGDLLTEPQVYQLMFKAKNEIAQKFQHWLAFEVLPAIRMTGGYIPINQEMSESEIMAKALQISQKTIDKKDKIIAMQKPKVESYNRFMISEGVLTWNDTAKILGIGRNIMLRMLRHMEIIDSNNKPYQKYMKYFVIRANEFNGRCNSTTYIKPVGIEFLSKLIDKYMIDIE